MVADCEECFKHFSWRGTDWKDFSCIYICDRKDFMSMKNPLTPYIYIYIWGPR